MSCRKNEGNVFSGLSNFNFGCCFNSSPESQFFPTPISAGAGAEVKVGEPLLVSPGEEKILHLSQACLGESKSKGSEQVFLYVKFEFFPLPRRNLLVNTDSEEDFPLAVTDNGDVYSLDFLNENGGEEDDTDDDENESSGVDSEDSDEDSDDSLEEDEQTPKKAEASKKRPLDSANKTPAPDKKAKLVTPQKTDGKKGVAHVDTPHPSKKAGKMPAANDKTKQQTPKSANAAFPCKTCNRTFGSETALQSHTKAKHTADK
ncbi:histone deacetylase HDT1 [Cucumis melo var. makuwa]|uniref:Histone deacetylase HDT1 n=1 Tax=Cucumis melo var. makuwa TaxID=1194695 RepID=A0A5D3DNQ0_CUCMM|nr:histone deacetylase HDT1 [Cucumis melo var. makuwa]